MNGKQGVREYLDHWHEATRHKLEGWSYPLIMSFMTHLIIIIFILMMSALAWPDEWSQVEGYFWALLVSIILGLEGSCYFIEEISDAARVYVLRVVNEVVSDEDYKKIDEALLEKDSEKRKKIGPVRRFLGLRILSKK